jgi:formylmethanofuran dehydrogenase subunit E
MNAAEALRAIRFDQLSYIQKKVTVDFDSLLQAPVYFCHGNERHLVREILGRFRMRPDDLPGGFLVRTAEDEIYFLYLQRTDLQRRLSDCRWVLSFRILSDREVMAFYRDERKMLVNMTVKRVVDFHGHLCPELVIGMKACEYAQELLFPNEQPKGRVSVVAENCTSALDAFQVLLGVTVGNQCLKIFDVGKHNYIFSSRDSGRCFILRLKVQYFGDEHEYTALEEKTRGNRITLDEVVDFQKLLDGRVRKLLAANPEELFEVEKSGAVPQTPEYAPAYVPCSSCGEQMLLERAVPFEGRLYCIPCFHLLSGPEKGQSLH